MPEHHKTTPHMHLEGWQAKALAALRKLPMENQLKHMKDMYNAMRTSTFHGSDTGPLKLATDIQSRAVYCKDASVLKAAEFLTSLRVQYIIEMTQYDSPVAV